MSGAQLELFRAGRAAPAAAPTPITAASACRVRACPAHLLGQPCADHDTPAIRAMARPHRYVFLGEHVALESVPWDGVDRLAVDDSASAHHELVQQSAGPAPFQSPAAQDDVIGLDVAVGESGPAARDVVQPPCALPCWGWCGRSSCAPGCHPGSRFGRAPLIPCLACGRGFFSCQAAPGSALTCSAPCRDMWSVLLAGDDAQVQAFAEQHLDGDLLERWQERAAIMEAERERHAAGRALAAIWRARQERGVWA